MNRWVNAEVGTAMLTLMLLGVGCRGADKDEPSGAAASATAAALGGHANEEYCKTLLAQFELFGKFDPSDIPKRSNPNDH